MCNRIVLHFFTKSNMGRVKYFPPSETVFRSLFTEGVTLDRLRGGGIKDISVFKSSLPYIKGSGWLGRIALPLFKKYIAPNLLELGSNVLSDINSGSKLKSSLNSGSVTHRTILHTSFFSFFL